MDNLLSKLFIRGTGIAVGLAGIYLIIETVKAVPSFLYVVTPIFGTIGLGVGLFCILYDGWIK